jgi:hypothetical protein
MEISELLLEKETNIMRLIKENKLTTWLKIQSIFLKIQLLKHTRLNMKWIFLKKKKPKLFIILKIKILTHRKISKTNKIKNIHLIFKKMHETF